MKITHVLVNNSLLGKISKEQRSANWEVWQTSLHNPNFADYGLQTFSLRRWGSNGFSLCMSPSSIHATSRVYSPCAAETMLLEWVRTTEIHGKRVMLTTDSCSSYL